MKTSCLFFILVAVLAISYTEAVNCPAAGFFPDNSDCHAFTMCYADPSSRTGMKGVELKCPPGMAYDRDAGYCSTAALKSFC